MSSYFSSRLMFFGKKSGIYVVYKEKGKKEKEKRKKQTKIQKPKIKKPECKKQNLTQVKIVVEIPTSEFFLCSVVVLSQNPTTLRPDRVCFFKSISR